MSILNRRPRRYSTSDLFWAPNPAPSDGIVGDVNTMRLDPGHLDMAQDVIIDTAGTLRSRGGVSSYTADTFAYYITGAAQLPINSGTQAGTILAVVDSSANYKLYGTTAIGLTGFAQLTTTSTTGANNNTLASSCVTSPSFAKLPDNKGVICCGITTNTGSNGFPTWGFPFIWGGNAAITSDTSTGTAASTQGSRTVTGVGTAWTNALEGCYLYIQNATFGAKTYVGQVDSVISATSIRLKKGAQETSAANTPYFKAARFPTAIVYKGRITTSTTSAVVVGAGTKFVTSGPAGSGALYLTYNAAATIFRYSDGAYVGKVSTVTNDTTLTLAANAAINMSNEEYYLLINSGPGTNGTVEAGTGAPFSASCVEYWAGRFWYGAPAAQDYGLLGTGAGGSQYSPYYNNAPLASFTSPNGLIFSKKDEPEYLDLDPASGDILKLPNGASADGIRGLCATRGGLVVFRLNDTFLITGYSPDTFRAIKLVDDGTNFNQSYKPYKDGVVWAGRKSIWYFDGSRVVDLLQKKLKRFYRRTVVTNLSLRGVGLSVVSDNILVSYSPNPTITWPYKNTTRYLQHITMNLNLANGAISFFTNLWCVNGLTAADGTGIVIADGGPSTSSFIINGDKIFNESTTAANNYDAVNTGVLFFNTGASIGPDVMFETTKLTLGNAARLKFWKMLLLNYSSDVAMQADIIGTHATGVDFPNIATGTPTVVTFPVSSDIGILKRVKFLIRTPQLMIRVYQVNAPSATSQKFKLFWYTVGGKWMREGRQQ